MSHRDSLIKKNKELAKPMDLMNVGFVGAAGGGGVTYTGSSVTEVTSGGYRYIKFLDDGTIDTIGLSVEVLVVGAGGGGLIVTSAAARTLLQPPLPLEQWSCLA